MNNSQAPSLISARRLGIRAVKEGLETLDLARIHEGALISLVSSQDSSRDRDMMIRRAGVFFAEAITPIEETHRGARETNVQLKAMIEALTLRTNELAASNEDLKLEIVHRKSIEDSLRISELTSSQLLDKSRQMQQELRHLSRRLLSIQEEERKRISRELHDVIAQTLTGINVRLTSLKSKSTSGAQDLHRKIAITQKLVEKSVEIVHRFARDLRPAVLDDLGLIPALHSHLKGFMKDTGVRVTLEAFAGVEKLDGSKRTVLYRVAQEALANIARHAKATTSSVTIHPVKGAVRMEVKDDGCGFKLDGIESVQVGNRLGLLGMRERVEMVGGHFCILSTPGEGTTVRIEIPLANSPARKSSTKRAKNPTLECP